MQKSFNHKQKAILIGLATIATLLMCYFGFNYLKGINIFDKTTTYYARFTNVQGVDRSTSVYLNGYVVGNVRGISFDYDTYSGAVVELALDNSLRLPQNSIAIIRNNPLGGGSIHIYPPKESSHEANAYLAPRDTLIGEAGKDFIASISEELLPNLNTALHSIDSLTRSINNLVNHPDIAKTIAQLNASTRAIQSTTQRLDGMMANQVPSILDKVEQSSSSLQSVTAQLEAADLEQTLTNFSQVVAELQQVASQLNSQESSLGLLIHDDQLYHRLNTAVQSADSLLQDIKLHPKRYVKFSLF